MLAAELLEAGQALVEDVQRGAVAQADAFIISEGDTRHRSHLVAGEQLVAQIEGLEAHAAGVNEEVKRTLRLHHPDVRNRLEAGIDELAADIVFTAQVFDERLVPLQCGEPAVL